MPSLKTITQTYGMAHVTAEKAMALLREEGLIVVVMGRGAFAGRPALTFPGLAQLGTYAVHQD
jgi:DNA-binding GntR family transcriptional regulator